LIVAEAVLEIHGNLRKVAERSEGPISTSQRHQMAEYIHTHTAAKIMAAAAKPFFKEVVKG